MKMVFFAVANFAALFGQQKAGLDRESRSDLRMAWLPCWRRLCLFALLPFDPSLNIVAQPVTVGRSSEADRPLGSGCGPSEIADPLATGHRNRSFLSGCYRALMCWIELGCVSCCVRLYRPTHRRCQHAGRP